MDSAPTAFDFDNERCSVAELGQKVGLVVLVFAVVQKWIASFREIKYFSRYAPRLSKPAVPDNSNGQNIGAKLATVDRGDPRVCRPSHPIVMEA